MMKFAIIGCGIISRTHAAGIRQIPGVELAICCDIIPERMQLLAQEYNIPAMTADYREILANPKISAVSICTDHASHAEIFCDALNAGKHVICEKVPGRTPEDLKKMSAAVKAHPELTASGIFQHRFVPGNIAMRELIRQKKFGKLLTVNLNFCCLRTREYYQRDAWRGTFSGEGGGVLINQAIHFLDQLRFYFGEVKSVTAKTANLTHQGIIETEDTAAFVAEFADGLFVTANATNSASVKWRSAMTVCGSEMQLEFIDEKLHYINGSDPEKVAEVQNILTGAANGTAEVVGKSYYGSGHTAQLADFVAAINEKRAPRVTFADAANSAALVHAVYAAASGTWQDVADYR